MRVRSATLCLTLMTVLVSAFAVPSAASSSSSFCYAGAVTVDGHEVASGWVVCCDGDPDDPATWSNCHYGKWWPNPPPVRVKVQLP